MKLIPLTQGKFAMVDDWNYEWLMQWSWYAEYNHKNWYAKRRKFTKDESFAIPMHRQILGLTKGDGIITDHKDHNGLNNLISNIRPCTHSQNQANQKTKRKGTKGTSVYRGVSRDKRRSGKWHAQIKKNKKDMNIGYFVDEIEAAEAYDKKAKEVFGEFACLNFP